MYIKYKNIVIFKFIRSHFSLKNRLFEARLNCTVFVGVEKQKQIDVTFLCALGGSGFLFFLIDFIYYTFDFQLYICKFVNKIYV